MASNTKYFEFVHSPNSDLYFKECQENLTKFWNENKASQIEWMKKQISKRTEVANKYNIPCGNTEGWGMINWYENPNLDWSFIKEAGNICVDIALENNYKFICTSNFTHPQFKGIWSDIAWHKQLTKKIKS